MTDTDTRTLEIVMESGIDRITIPATWRITYGPVIGAAGKTSYGGNALRVWEGKDHQRGLWNNVISFRDLSITRLIAAIRKFGDTEWWRDDGTWIGPFADLVEKAWMSADDVISGIPPFHPAIEAMDAAPRDPGRKSW